MARNTELQRYRDETFDAFSNSLSVTADEVSILDGCTATAAELNILDGVTATTAEINKLDGASPLSFTGTVTAKTDDYTATLADANTCLTFGTASAKTLTIPANSSVAFPVGTVIAVGKSTNDLTLAVTTDTLWGGTTIPASTAALVIKVATTTWISIIGEAN